MNKSETIREWAIRKLVAHIFLLPMAGFPNSINTEQ